MSGLLYSLYEVAEGRCNTEHKKEAMKKQLRDMKPWSLWPITGILNAALYKAIIYIQPQLILQMISTTLLRIHNLPALIHRRVGRRERVLAWLNNILKDRNIPDIQTVWCDGSILCSVIDSTIPRLDFPDPSSLRIAQNFAFIYLGVPPAFTEEELRQETFYPHLERRLVRYLCSLQSAIARHPSLPLSPDLHPSPPISSCLARGMGLITAAQYDIAHFYLYLLDANLALGEISIEVQSNQDFGFARIDHKYSKSVPRKLANIPIQFVFNSNSLRINYTPQNSGMHQLSILRRGFHIQGSPFSVPVEKNDPTQSFKTNIQERRGAPRKKLRVLLRIVDFVTEKMLLTEDGKLETITAKDFLEFRKNSSLAKGVLVGKQGEERGESTEVGHDSQAKSREGGPTLDPVNSKWLQRQVSVRSPSASPVRVRERDEAMDKGKEFKTRCKKIVAACHFIMNHGSKQKRVALLNAAGELLDGRPVTLGAGIEQLLNIVPSISIEDTDEESILNITTPCNDSEVGHASGEVADLEERQEITTLEEYSRPLMFVDNMFTDNDEMGLEWYNDHDTPSSSDSLETQKGPASSSSPYCDDNDDNTTFTDIDTYLSKDFTEYMTSETQFHLWPSDVAFGEHCQQSTAEEEAMVDFDAVIAAPNLEEALNKLEQGLKKRKAEAKRDEKTVMSDTGEELLHSSSSSTFGNGALNSQQSEEMPLINFEEDSFDPIFNEKGDSAVSPLNEVQELRSTVEGNRYISSEIAEGGVHGYLETFVSKEDLETKPNTFVDEDFTLFSYFSEDNSQKGCASSPEPCPPPDRFDTNQEDSPPLVYDIDDPPEYYESDEEGRSPHPDGDSAYLSIEDIQNSFGYSPENRSNDDPTQYSHKQDKPANPLDFEDAEILNWNQNGNLAITGFMGPAERDVLGIVDGEEMEENLQVNWQGVSRYTRVLTPQTNHMSAIAEEEEEERVNESGVDEETEDSKLTQDEDEVSNSSLHNIDTGNTISHIHVVNSSEVVKEEVSQDELNSIQENTDSLCISHDNSNADETLLNFIYVDFKKQLIEIEGGNIINPISEIIDVSAVENYISETAVESSESLVDEDDEYVHIEKTVDDVDGMNGEHIERENSGTVTDKTTLVKSNSKEDIAKQKGSMEMNDNDVINDVKISAVSGNLIDGFPVAMKVKMRKEYWDIKLLGGNQSINLKKGYPHTQFTNTQTRMQSNCLGIGAKNEDGLQLDRSKNGREVFREEDSWSMIEKSVEEYEEEEDEVIENVITGTTRKYWNNVLETNVSRPVTVRSPSLHHARRVMVSEDCEDEDLPSTPLPLEPKPESVLSRDLVNQRRTQQIISTINTPRYNKINKEEIRSRFEKAKHFFQSLEHNSGELDSPLKTQDDNSSRKRRGKRGKKSLKATSAPSSDSETAARTARQDGSAAGGSERIKVAERFHVKDLFKDVTGGQDAGFMKGIPHRAAVLRALQSMEMGRPISPYEEANYCCPHEDHSKENDQHISRRNLMDVETVYFV